MRLVGTTRTAVALVLFAAAASLPPPSRVAEQPPEEAVAAPASSDGEAVSIAWGGDVTLGSSYGQPAQRRARRCSRRRARAAQGRHRRGQLRGDVRPGRRLQVRRRQRELLRLPGARGQRARRCAGPAWTSSTTPTTTRSTTARSAGAPRATRSSAPRSAATGAPGEIEIVSATAPRSRSSASRPTRWTNPMGDDAAVRARVQSAAGAGRHRRRVLPRGRRGRGQAARPARPGVGVRRVPRRQPPLRARRRSTPAPTSCSAPARTSCAALELYKNRLIAYSLGNLAGCKNFGTAASSLSALTVAVTRAASCGRIDSCASTARVPHGPTRRGKLMRR